MLGNIRQPNLRGIAIALDDILRGRFTTKLKVVKNSPPLPVESYRNFWICSRDSPVSWAIKSTAMPE